MANINFVPDDYVQSTESRRTNIIYLVLFGLVMAGLAGAFMTIKVRQRSITLKEQMVNAQMAKAQDSIQQFEELQEKRKAMMKTALTTAELLEPVPRSVLLASITNNLPAGVSLIKLELQQEEIKQRTPSRATAQAAATKYQQAQSPAAAANPATETFSPARMTRTNISIEGIAPSDLQVAAYIENLGFSVLLDNVALVESKEYKIDESKFRQFKLTATLKHDTQLTKEDIGIIRSKAQPAGVSF
ncbi:MAG: PilN domain-containing protein [Phycisphaerae bacterium]